MTSRRKRALESLSRDIEEHIQCETEENIARGMSPTEARNVAIRKFGNRTAIQEHTRAVWTPLWLEQMAQDVRYALRTFAKNPGFTMVAILTLTLGIGMTTAVFSILDALLLRPLPYPAPGRLVWISHHCLHSSGDCFMARSDFIVFRQRAHAFDRMTLIGNEDLAMASPLAPSAVQTERIGSIEGDFWQITGARPALGRLFRPGESDAAVLTWDVFQRSFRGNPAVVGKQITLEGHAFTVTGVLSGSFKNVFPQALYTGDEARAIAYIPTPPGHELPGDPIRPNTALAPSPPWFRIVGRLKPDASLNDARTEIQTIYDRLAKEYPHTASHDSEQATLRVQMLKDRLEEPVRATLLTLFGAAFFVFLIAVGNISNLLLARASTRGREIAIRSAIGAGRWRVARQFLAESVTLAMLGGTSGILFAYFCLRFIAQANLNAVPRLNDGRVDTTVLAFAFVVSCVAGMLFGLVPLVVNSRQTIADVLKRNAGNATAGLGLLRTRRFFVIAQVGLAMVLFIGAGLMLKSFGEMSSHPPGFDPEQIVTARILLSGPGYDRQWPRQKNYLDRLLQGGQSIPGVEAFGIDCGMMTQPLKLPGTVDTESNLISGGVRYVSIGYLKALGIPLLGGTWPKADDQMFDVALVNKSLANEVGPRRIIGNRIKGSTFSATIVGVVSDFKDRRLDAEPSPQVYVAYPLAPSIRSVRLVLRTSLDVRAVIGPLRQLLANIDKGVPTLELETLEQELSQSVAPRRFNFFVLGTFSATALSLALIGIYGVIGYLVTQRTPEIGIRMSFGASPGNVLAMILKEGMRMMLAGILAGVGGAFILSKVIAGLLYGVRPTDIETLGVSAVIFACAGLFACLIPAARAARIDPVSALRSE